MNKIITLFFLLLLSFNASATVCNVPPSDLILDLSWVAAIEREDNTPITPDEIGGYKIYWSDTPGAYDCSLTINDGAALKHSINILENTPYYLVITTIDIEGRESQYSKEIFIPKLVKDDPPVVIEPIKPPSSVDFTMPDGYKEAVDAPNIGPSL